MSWRHAHTPRDLQMPVWQYASNKHISGVVNKS